MSSLRRTDKSLGKMESKLGIMVPILPNLDHDRSAIL